jgi:A-factor biosynthesis hotdog domain
MGLNPQLQEPAEEYAADPFSVVVPSSWPTRSNAELHVDQRHPFFFDHPLDHVSGMLLITGLLDLVRSSSGRPFDVRAGYRIRLDLKFGRICELDGAVTLSAHRADGHGVHTVGAIQDGHEVCGGRVELVSEDLPTISGHGAGTIVPIAAELVRRADPRNVILGVPEIDSDHYRVPLVAPPSEHFLLRNGDERYGVEELVEAGRQLVTVASYGPHGRSSNTHLLWIGVTADLPVALRRSVPLELRWPVTPARGNTAVLEFELVARETGHPMGSLSYVIKSCTSVTYARLREQRRPA